MSDSGLDLLDVLFVLMQFLGLCLGLVVISGAEVGAALCRLAVRLLFHAVCPIAAAPPTRKMQLPRAIAWF